MDIRANAAIKKLKPMIVKALENLEAKVEFFQRMSTDEAIAVRLAEASTGSKWKHSHPTKLAAVIEKFPKYKAAFDKLGLKDDMDSNAVMSHLKEKHICDKK